MYAFIVKKEAQKTVADKQIVASYSEGGRSILLMNIVTHPADYVVL